MTLNKGAKEGLQPVIETLRREKQSALELLASTSPVTAPVAFPDDDLGAILRGHALELWRDMAGGCVFIVADEADALRLKERRGQVLTVEELQLVVRIKDPPTVAEVLRWKRGFDGVLSERIHKKLLRRH